MAVYRIIPPGDVLLGPKDPTTGKRRIVMYSGVDYVRQKIAVRLKFFLGEWFRDTRQGVPWFRDVLVQNPDLNVIRSVYRAVILSVQEVSSVDRIDLVWTKPLREVAVEFDATLVAGGVLLVRQPDPPFIIQVQRAA